MQYRADINLVRQNLRLVKELYPVLTRKELGSLRDLTRTIGLSVSRGEILLVNGKWYVTHGGLLRIALQRQCRGIRTVLQEKQCDPIARRWVFRATVYKSRGSRGFVGYGDADPSNVSPLVRGAEMRVAETRAVNRALRKAYGIGLCSVEEIGSTPVRFEPATDAPPKHAPKSVNNGNGTNMTLRDRLTQLIRQHHLDPSLVKLYAADFCGVHELRSASRELVEDFVNELAGHAAADRDALLCKLNSYAPKQQGVA